MRARASRVGLCTSFPTASAGSSRGAASGCGVTREWRVTICRFGRRPRTGLRRSANRGLSPQHSRTMEASPSRREDRHMFGSGAAGGTSRGPSDRRSHLHFHRIGASAFARAARHRARSFSASRHLRLFPLPAPCGRLDRSPGSVTSSSRQQPGKSIGLSVPMPRRRGGDDRQALGSAAGSALDRDADRRRQFGLLGNWRLALASACAHRGSYRLVLEDSARLSSSSLCGGFDRSNGEVAAARWQQGGPNAASAGMANSIGTASETDRSQSERMATLLLLPPM